MGFFGKKKGNDASADADKSALFAGRKSTPQAQSANPYAAPPANDPYAPSSNPPPPYPSSGSMDTFRQEKSPSVTGPGQRFGGGGGGYGASGAPPHNGAYGGRNPYGGHGGYGASGASYSSAGYGGGDRFRGSGRTGGYGGLGDEDAGRDQLFGGAAVRHAQRHQQQQSPPPQQGHGAQNGSPHGQSSGYDTDGNSGANSGGYGAYGERELTDEEQVAQINKETSDTRDASIETLSKIEEIAQGAITVGESTVATLAVQHNQISHVHQNLHDTHAENNRAKEQTAKLHQENRSMFVPRIGNPIGAASRRKEQERKDLETHRSHRDERDTIRKDRFEQQSRFQQAMRNTGRNHDSPSKFGDLKQRSKYVVEDDEPEQHQKENDIYEREERIGQYVGKMHGLSEAAQEMIKKQNRELDKVAEMADKVDDGVWQNARKLERELK